MMAYLDSNDDKVTKTFDGIERFVKYSKCHKNVADQDKASITRIWRESMSL